MASISCDANLGEIQFVTDSTGDISTVLGSTYTFANGTAGADSITAADGSTYILAYSPSDSVLTVTGEATLPAAAIEEKDGTKAVAESAGSVIFSDTTYGTTTFSLDSVGAFTAVTLDETKFSGANVSYSATSDTATWSDTSYSYVAKWIDNTTDTATAHFTFQLFFSFSFSFLI